MIIIINCRMDSHYQILLMALPSHSPSLTLTPLAAFVACQLQSYLTLHLVKVTFVAIIIRIFAFLLKLMSLHLDQMCWATELVIQE